MSDWADAVRFSIRSAFVRRSSSIVSAKCVFEPGHLGPCEPWDLAKTTRAVMCLPGLIADRPCALKAKDGFCGTCGHAAEEHGPETGAHRARPCPGDDHRHVGLV